MRRLALLPLLGVAVALALVVRGGGDDTYTVYMKLDDAGGILQNYNVKVGQIPAGKVKGIALDKRDDVVLRLELDRSAAPIGAGASAQVRPVNLLGEKYVDLDPGDLRHPLPEGSTIPRSRTGIPVELDDALNLLDPDTRGALRILINEAGTTMAGRGSDFNRTLADLPPALDAARRVVGEVAAENRSLRQAVVRGDRVLASVTAGRDDLGDLVESAADALSTAAERRSRLGDTVRTAPAALAKLRGTLAELQGTAADLTPAARDLRAATPSLATTLQRLPAFAADARGTLKTATGVSPALSRLARQSTPTLTRLRPTVQRLATFARDFQPLLGALDKDKGLRELLDFADGWAGVTYTRDAVGHVFRLRLTYDKEFVTSILERAFGPAKTRRRRSTPAAKRPVAAPKPAAAPARTPQAAAPVQGVLDRTLKGVQDTVNGVVGQLQQPRSGDAQKLLNYLLGS